MIQKFTQQTNFGFKEKEMEDKRPELLLLLLLACCLHSAEGVVTGLLIFASGQQIYAKLGTQQ